jgi:hypothetical protein
MPADFGINNTFGLSAPSGGVVEESSTEDEVEAKTIRDENGTTCRAVPSRMIKTTVTIKGRGRSDLSVAAGSLSGSVKVISVKNSETNEDFPTFEVTGVKYTSRG